MCSLKTYFVYVRLLDGCTLQRKQIVKNDPSHHMIWIPQLMLVDTINGSILWASTWFNRRSWKNQIVQRFYPYILHKFCAKDHRILKIGAHRINIFVFTSFPYSLMLLRLFIGICSSVLLVGCNQGFLQTGQKADIVLGEIGFNQSGGPLLFNHPKGIDTDGTVPMMADGNNNRVLLWDGLPTSNV